jgi:hypothetical protein
MFFGIQLTNEIFSKQVCIPQSNFQKKIKNKNFSCCQVNMMLIEGFPKAKPDVFEISGVQDSFPNSHISVIVHI